MTEQAGLDLFELVYLDGTGTPQRDGLSACWDRPFELGDPVRRFPVFKGQKNFTGRWWAATTGDHVGYESWLERAEVIRLDFMLSVVGIASQPFRICWREGRRERAHTPDYFARLADGSALVVDVRADDRIGERDAEAFEVTASMCQQVGWSFERVGAPAPVFAANMRWLAGYRHPRNLNPQVARPVLEAFSEPLPVAEGVTRVGEPIKVLPTLFHLLWRQLLITDLKASVLSQRSIVGAGGRVP